jgi:hypothetical protein
MNDDRLLNYLAFIHYGLKERVPIDGFASNNILPAGNSRVRRAFTLVKRLRVQYTLGHNQVGGGRQCRGKSGASRK